MNLILCFLFLFLKINDSSKAMSDVQRPKHPAYLVVITEQNGNYHCIGTLISFSQVLTAGSCVKNALSGLQVVPLDYLSYLNPEVNIRKVSKIISQQDKNKFKPIDRLVVLELMTSYSDEENKNLKPVAIPKKDDLADEATEYRVITATLEEQINPHYDLLNHEEEYAKHLKTSPDRQVTPAARSGGNASTNMSSKGYKAPNNSSLQNTITIEDAHPLLTLHISSVLTQPSKGCDDLVKDYFDSKENSHKIICSNYSSSPGVCKKDYGAPLVDGEVLVGIMSYSKSDCRDPGVYQAVHQDNVFLKCARTCQKDSCDDCKDVMSVTQVPESVYEQIKEQAPLNEKRSGDTRSGLEDCPDLPSSSTTAVRNRIQATNPQILLIMMSCLILYFVE